MASDDINATSVAVRTTLPRLPLPPSSEWSVIHTERLLLRPLTQDDLEAYYALRRQPEFMAESSLGKPDSDISETQAALDDLVNPERENFLFGIFIAATGELIGDGGIHTIRFGPLGWPEIGYKLAPAYWGRGYGTESMGGLLKAWWQLPRQEAEIKVHPNSLWKNEEVEGPVLSREHVVAEIATYNKGSQRVVEKLGFRHFGTWEEPDTQLHRLGQPLELGHYALSSPP
ncbi:hypothetical protein GQX73_g4059 [Xylaria multiplex]|uniref:N-acetyltransferase domain-containing protein n=1 Tax=Xylaria multiplex TaxID=323545 RepID=A0A7C8ISZ6_9PEZI|nr:hypothetical protein GQX73_g4059 [Xylaria multiplex]